MNNFFLLVSHLRLDQINDDQDELFTFIFRFLLYLFVISLVRDYGNRHLNKGLVFRPPFEYQTTKVRRDYRSRIAVSKIDRNFL